MTMSNLVSVNSLCGMLCQLINSKLVSTACSLSDLGRLVSEGGDWHGTLYSGPEDLGPGTGDWLILKLLP